MIHKHNYVESTNGTSIYCTICGKSQVLRHECMYERIDTLTISTGYGSTHTYIYVQRCSICGDIIEDRVKV